MNNLKKGRRLEYNVANYLKRFGEIVVFRSVQIKFHNVDFANAFDIVSVKPNKGFRFVQVKSNVNPFNVLKDILERVKFMIVPNCSYEVWSHKGKGVYKICSYDVDNGYRMYDLKMVRIDEENKCK